MREWRFQLADTAEQRTQRPSFSFTFVNPRRTEDTASSNEGSIPYEPSKKFVVPKLPLKFSFCPNWHWVIFTVTYVPLPFVFRLTAATRMLK